MNRFERRVTQDVTIKGIYLPKDSSVIVSPYAMHRNSEIYPEPEKFRPERYSLQCSKLLDEQVSYVNFNQ